MAAKGPSLLEQGWYQDNWLTRLLRPVSKLFAVVSKRRRFAQQRQATDNPLSIPVIVVGNISVGGTGKTPLLIFLVQALQAAGYRPGVISRGYGGKAPTYPLMVSADTPPQEGGDEPVLIASQCQCPVVVDPNRRQGAEYLITHSDCNIILSDDGLQHYRLPRQLEIAVIDGNRGFGNGKLFPAGPLREPLSRLSEVDFVISNGQLAPQIAEQIGVVPTVMSVEPVGELRPLLPGPKRQPVRARDWPFTRREVHAVAGIGNPQRFVDTLTKLGFVPTLTAYPDHHKYCPEDLELTPGRPIILTAKDAVKCRSFASSDADCWVLDVAAKLPSEWFDGLLNKLR
ncbi:tetraacyldisaccharide 4'-kinase [bacterium SCSIO 12696]|nr:tetraacyldisaccharide 4'-kinase [bacterium SCSIO 12696]